MTGRAEMVAGEAEAVKKANLLVSEKAVMEKAHATELHKAEKKIVKLTTQVKMSENVVNAIQMGMKMANSKKPSFVDSPASGSSTSSAASSGTKAPPFQGLFSVASPD